MLILNSLALPGFVQFSCGANQFMRFMKQGREGMSIISHVIFFALYCPYTVKCEEVEFCKTISG